MYRTRKSNTVLLGILLIVISACTPSSTTSPTASLASPPTASPTSLPTPSPSAIDALDSAACLEGDWLIGMQIEQLLVNLTSIPSLEVKGGSLYLRFEEDRFAYHSDDLALRSSFLDSYLEAKARILIEGTYTVDHQDQVHFYQTNIKNELYDWQVVKGDYVRPFTGTSPIFDFKIAEEGLYSCQINNLTLIFLEVGEELVIDLTRVD